MNKNKVNSEDPHGLSGKKGVRGKYAEAYKNGYSVRIYDKDKLVSDRFYAAIEPDVRERFPDSRSINEALRKAITMIPKRLRSPQ